MQFNHLADSSSLSPSPTNPNDYYYYYSLHVPPSSTPKSYRSLITPQNAEEPTLRDPARCCWEPCVIPDVARGIHPCNVSWQQLVRPYYYYLRVTNLMVRAFALSRRIGPVSAVAVPRCVLS
ncbi:hypothetical protein B296_00005068 [Ensete ventricosum]|uniref:Uncharacterized protein n=1 Tax=Ensete ventricosum TaxID=4639 RepID=A0A427B0K4_ENSVE|nr:hypothetical protein B296_00005068 [Ensete ventricosum]